MSFCRKCGAQIPEGSNFCPNCGWSPKGVVARSTPVQQVVVKNGVSVLLVIVVAGILLVVGGLGFLFIQKGHYAQICFYTHSIHITETVSVEIYVDGEYVTTWKELKPGEYLRSSSWYMYNFPVYHSKKTVTIVAQSTGGLLGNITDSETIVVENGGQYYVHLYV